MKTNRKLTVLRLLVLGALVAGFNAKPASAQLFQGKFTLPFTARWSSATLPAGDYSLTLDKATIDGMVMVYRGTHCVALIPTRGISGTASDWSKIVLEGGTVRELSLPQIGVTLLYPAPNPRHQAAPEGSQVARNIPVDAAGAGR
jgi:hypothetical protein